MVRVVNLFSVVRPAVQNTYKRLQIQEVHFRLHSNVQLSRLLLPLFSAGSLPVMFTSKTSNKTQEVELLFYCLFVCIL